MQQEIIDHLLKTQALTSTNNFFNFTVNPDKILKNLLPKIPLDSHKAIFGHVMVISGHNNTSGAARLSAISALRAGCGLLTILNMFDTHEQNADIPEIMHKTYDEHNKDFFNKVDCLVIGPGLSKDNKFQNQALKILKHATQHCKYMVIDADALDLIKNNKIDFGKCEVILTPHPKEASLMLDIETQDVINDRFLAIQKISSMNNIKNTNLTVILKGATCLIYNKSRFFIFNNDEALLATAGTGDILSGSIAALVLQTNCALSACILAVSLSLMSAKSFHKFASRGILASEFTLLFPYLLKR